MNILIGGDLVPTATNKSLFENGKAEALVGRELLDVLNKADYRIFNLETPLTDVEAPIDKNGPNLIAPTAAVKGYTALGVNLLSLANNHILDQGSDGLKATIEALEQNNIAHLGAGDNLSVAAKPYIFELDGEKIGVYACAEHEFTIATETTGGANPFDCLETFDHILSLKKQCDYVIVLYHGGKEHYRYPSPNLQRVCRKLVEKGADLVICQHSHCIGCEEKYMNGTIVYGQGNFIFDYSNNEFWQTSLLIGIEGKKIIYYPIEKKQNIIGLANGEQAKKILDEFYARSEEIKLEGFIEREYKNFADEMIRGYLLALSGKKGIIFKAVNKLSRHKFVKRYIRSRYKKANLLSVKNVIECEAHRELLLRGICNE